MLISELREGMKVRDRWWSKFPGIVRKVGKRTAIIHFTGDETIAGTHRWDKEAIEFLEPWIDQNENNHQLEFHCDTHGGPRRENVAPVHRQE